MRKEKGFEGNEKQILPPLVSVIMGIYNCEPTLEEAIESILSQTYTTVSYTHLTLPTIA